MAGTMQPQFKQYKKYYNHSFLLFYDKPGSFDDPNAACHINKRKDRLDDSLMIIYIMKKLP